MSVTVMFFLCYDQIDLSAATDTKMFSKRKIEKPECYINADVLKPYFVAIKRSNEQLNQAK